MKKKSNKLSAKLAYILVIILIISSLTYFSLLYFLKITPALGTANKTLADIVNFRQQPQKMVYGNSSASITITAYSGFACRECRDFYGSLFLYLKENHINKSNVRYYYAPFVVREDIDSENIEYNISRYLYCSSEAGSIDFWEEYESFFLMSASESQEYIDSAKGNFFECYEKYSGNAINIRHNENLFFGINSQPTLIIGVENADNSIIIGVPSEESLERIIRQKEISIGKAD